MSTGLTETIVAWQSKGLSNEKIRPPTSLIYSLSPKLKWHNSTIRVELKGSYLKTRQSNFFTKQCSKFIYCL